MTSLFYGTWNLIIQLAFLKDDKTPYYPRSADAVGQLMYDVTGRVAVQLMNPYHPFTDLDNYDAAMKGCLVYFGRFHIDEEAKVVTHEIEFCSYSTFMEEDQKHQKRAYEFNADGTKLTLTAKTEETRVLVWQRIT